MRILGDGWDYYDSLQAREDPVVFVREKDRTMLSKQMERLTGIKPDVRYLNINDAPPNNFRRFWGRDNQIEVTERGTLYLYSIWFTNVFVAGKRYQGLRLEPNNTRKSTEFFWTQEGFEEWVKQQGLRIHERNQKDVFYRQDSVYAPISTYFGVKDDPVVRDALITQGIALMWCDVRADLWENTLQRERTVWKINGAGLDGFQFQKVLDPYQVYQELDMWISGVLPNAGRPTVEIRDIDKVHKAGFDTKWSFRRHKDDPK